MKSKTVLLIAAALASIASLIAAEKIAAGPKGGRLLDTEPQKLEFFVNSDRKVELNFLDAALVPVAPGEQVVAVTAEPKDGKAVLVLEKTATGFISRHALPSGEPYRVVVQVRTNPDAKPKNFRIDLRLEPCGECRHAEYACTCEGH